LGLCALAAVGCSGPDRVGAFYVSSSSPVAPFASGDINTDGRCKPFVRIFHEFVACQRSNGTFDSFVVRNIVWRVRYFVRYSEMPCREAPTVEEAYVYNLVVDDLNTDRDLNSSERIAIRDAMFEGESRCKIQP
jgi:hypothetical protein